MLSNNGLHLRTTAQYVLVCLVLMVNSYQFKILRSYILLLKLPILMRSWMTTLSTQFYLIFSGFEGGV